MEEKIKEYIKSEVNKLSEEGVVCVNLKGVYPSILESVLGAFAEMDTNGWQNDYWVKTDKYNISGTMYYGIATISLL